MNSCLVSSFSVLFLAACAVPPAVVVPPGPIDSEWSTSTAEAPAPLPLPRRLGDANTYTMAKLGVWIPDGDIDQLDDGVSGELVLGRKLVPFLSIEGAVGYLGAEGSGNSSMDLVPLFVNGRVSVPFLIFEGYGGIGIGGIYAEYESGPFSNDDFVAAMQAFLGVAVGLGGVSVGAEYRYLKSEDTEDDFAIEGGVASVFVSLPF